MPEVGRPTIMTDEALQILEDAFSVGATDLEACFLAKIGKSTLYNYQEKNPEFVERKEALKNMTKFKAKKVVSKDIDEGKADTAKWYLERKGKDEGFSSRQEVSGPDGKDLTFNVINYANTGLQVQSEKISDTTSPSS